MPPLPVSEIAVDIDNVISDTDSLIRKLIEVKLNKKVSSAQITKWSYSEAISITPTQEKEIFELFHQRFCKYVKVIPGALQGIKKLTQSYNVSLVTARPPASANLTLGWLARQGLAGLNVFHVKNKVDIASSWAFILEDNQETTRTFVEKGIPVVLFDRPWNSNYENDLVFRVSSWDNALEIVFADREFKRAVSLRIARCIETLI